MRDESRGEKSYRGDAPVAAAETRLRAGDLDALNRQTRRTVLHLLLGSVRSLLLLALSQQHVPSARRANNIQEVICLRERQVAFLDDERIYQS